MKRFVFLVLVLLSVLLSYSQDTVRLKHLNYTTVFSKSLRYPVLVEWWETRAKNNCPDPLPRKDQFQADPDLILYTSIANDYVGSGLDRGHMCPAASNRCSGPIVMTECFYFSNMSPQYHALNAGDWKTLEVYTRDQAVLHDSIFVWTGNTGEIYPKKVIGNITVPALCWKVLYFKKTKEFQAYLFANTTNKSTGLHSHQVDLIEIEKLTGFKFTKQ